MSVALTISTLLCVYKELFVGLFTDEDGIDVTIAMNCLGIFFYTNLVDMTLNFFMGCVRALGIQANIALISIGCFYLISIPSACYLAFLAGNGITGLWIGYFLGILVQMIIVGCMTIMADWQGIAD